ncbi:serine/threonine protein kinase, partial [Candidatus Sumerlaeota bacterium]|nr:serine/threonine protein kinase [Candidatus Sumerlaeota bacterium]
MSDIVVGATIGDYEIQRELGRGGMGVVFKARERTLQRAVALKFLPPDLASDPKFVEDFYREARAAAQINHPNIVTIFAVGEAEGRHFIAMEYVSGQTVWSMIKRFNQIHPVQSVEIGRQVCKALSAAHKLRIYHRDIKPHNIMVDEHGLVRVLDFGIARMRDPGAMIQKVEDELSGTPTYMSPEQFKMHTTDQRSDIYSLGVTLFHMMAGRPPFVTTEREMLKKMILDAPAPFIRKFNPEVPHALVQILEKAMAKRKEDRYSQASEMEEDLHQVARALRKTASASGGAQRDTPARPGEFNTPRGIPPSTTP